MKPVLSFNSIFSTAIKKQNKNSPAAQCSSSAPFSQSRSPSHRHDNETHLLTVPPQSNFSGGQPCRPVQKRWKKKKAGKVYLKLAQCFKMTENYIFVEQRQKVKALKKVFSFFLSPHLRFSYVCLNKAICRWYLVSNETNAMENKHDDKSSVLLIYYRHVYILEEHLQHEMLLNPSKSAFSCTRQLTQSSKVRLALKPNKVLGSGRYNLQT